MKNCTRTDCYCDDLKPGENCRNWHHVLNGSRQPLFRVRCEKAWDGDDVGNEWTCGAAVYRSDDADSFRVFEDDGAGNGNLLAELDNFGSAKEYAVLYCRNLDNGGHADSGDFIDMCRIAQRFGVETRSARQWSARNPG